jgi:hypothetical protein
MKNYIKENIMPLLIGFTIGTWAFIGLRIVEDLILKITMILTK